MLAQSRGTPIKNSPLKTSKKNNWQKVTPIIYSLSKGVEYFKEFETKYLKRARGNSGVETNS